jgi:hypothetical protein
LVIGVEPTFATISPEGLPRLATAAEALPDPPELGCEAAAPELLEPPPPPQQLSASASASAAPADEQSLRNRPFMGSDATSRGAECTDLFPNSGI